MPVTVLPLESVSENVVDRLTASSKVNVTGDGGGTLVAPFDGQGRCHRRRDSADAGWYTTSTQ